MINLTADCLAKFLFNLKRRKVNLEWLSSDGVPCFDGLNYIKVLTYDLIVEREKKQGTKSDTGQICRESFSVIKYQSTSLHINGEYN